MALCFAKSAKCAKLANMAKVVNVHKIDGEAFYLVRLTPQEVRPLLPDELDPEALPEGQVFMPRPPSVVVITADEGGGFVAECPAVPGCISQGETLEETLANLRDAVMVSMSNSKGQSDAP